MKQSLLFISLLFLSVSALAQTETENYIVSTKYNTEIPEQYLHYVPDELKRIDVAYFDGLGRPKQTIAVGAGEDWQDIITPIVYDNFGRQAKAYLPYADVSQYEPSLDFRQTSSLLASQETLYSAKHPEESFLGTVNAYSEKGYDGSPLNRVVEQGYPGAFGNINTHGGIDHTIKFEYETNSVSGVYNFTVTYADPLMTETPSLSVQGHYNAGQLYKTITKNENWTSILGKINTSEEFKDKKGRVVLKRNNLIDVSDLFTVVRHDTYYVYDRFGNLTFVIPPLAADQIVQGSNHINESVLLGLCYMYRYDYRNRVIEKKIPGKGWEYIVYDKLDRPILTQDQNLKSTNKWLFTKYDTFGRVVYTGQYTDSRTRKVIQDDLDDNINPILSETRLTTSFTNNGAVVYYSNSAFPSTNLALLTVNYYDDYNFDRAGIPVYTTNSFGTALKSNLKGLATGSKVRVLDTQNWTTSLMFYDDKARMVKSHEKNTYLSSELIKDMDLDFLGNVWSEKTTHKKLNLPDLTIYDEYIYDHRDRLVGHYQSQTPQNQAGANPHIININHYDELGQLVKKEVGGRINLPTTLQRVDFKYNIRGWLTDINDVDQSLSTSPDKDIFAFKLNYYTTTLSGSKKLYNGNISETHWKTRFDNRKRSYQYTYDYLDRLTNAAYRNYNYTIPATSYTENYTEGPITYDKNGNILSLERYGLDENATPSLQKIVKIDDLQYTYAGYSNQLTKIGDDALLPEGFKNGTNTGNDYEYDANGNMVKDLNKSIGTVSANGITYNHLNLPKRITFSTGGYIEYIYNAVGVKLQKKVVQSSGTIITQYDNGFIYEKGTGNNELKFYSHPEGYVNVPLPSSGAYNTNGFEYIYQYKDHLGNVRLSYRDVNNDGIIAVTELIEEDHYYAFGLKHKGYNTYASSIGEPKAQKYKYNDKELQDELGLNMTAMDFRQYDPAIGRFVVTDPFAELSYSMTPYKFAYNNPVYWNDPLGLFETKDEAKKYAKEHGIRTGWFSQNKIQKGADGTWSIDNSKAGTSIFAATADNAADLGVNEGDVVTSALVQSESESSEGSSFGWITMWGNDRSGDTSGLKGTTTHSLESSDFVTPSNSSSLNNKGASFLQWLVSWFTNSLSTYQQGITIQEAVQKNSNTPTMEVENKEPVTVTSSIKVVIYTFHLNDSTVTTNSQTAIFRGEASTVKRQIDSVERKNEIRASNKEAWLKSWKK